MDPIGKMQPRPFKRNFFRTSARKSVHTFKFREPRSLREEGRQGSSPLRGAPLVASLRVLDRLPRSGSVSAIGSYRSLFHNEKGTGLS
jgi:hypothetical protein